MLSRGSFQGYVGFAGTVQPSPQLAAAVADGAREPDVVGVACLPRGGDCGGAGAGALAPNAQRRSLR
eukprot:11158690-Lingulodinium_polyedra.AAC.1